MSGILTSTAEFFSVWRYSRIFFLLFFVLVGYGTWRFYFKHNSDALNYLTATVERTDIENLVTATGILQPFDYVDVGAQVSGQLKKLNVVIGQEVQAGDLLAEIDATVYKARVDGIRAQLRNQQAQLGDREAQVTLAKIRLDRQQNLFKDDATTKDALQAAEASYKSTQSLLRALQAQIQQTEYSLRVEDANLTYARIYAPMAGTVVSITSRQGQTLNANQQAPTIMRIANLSTMTVQTQVSEADIGKLRLGMPVYFTTLGGQDYRWYGKLNRIEPTPTVSNSVVLYNALFEVSNENHVLMTQMSAQVFFIAAREKNTLVIPASAVNFKPRKVGGEFADKKNWGDKKDLSDKKEWSDKKEKSDKKSTNDNTSIDDKKVTENTTLTENKKTDGASSSSENTKADSSPSVDTQSHSNKNTASEKTDAQKQKWQHRSPPVATAEVKPQSVTVQVMDERGQLTERKITIGISNRVQVQVLEGLQEGEKVVSGIRQLDKPTNYAAPMGAGAPGGAGAGARQMR